MSRTSVLSAPFFLSLLVLVSSSYAKEFVPMKGRVVLEGSGEPLVGAEVHIIGEHNAMVYLTNNRIQFSVSRADGSFERSIMIEPGGEFFFVIKSKEAPIWVSPMMYYDAKTAEFELKVPELGHWVVIRTMDEQGVTVENQFFGLNTERSFSKLSGGFPIHYFTADETGEYILGPLASGKYQIFMGIRGYAAEARSLDLTGMPGGAAAPTELEFRVRKVRYLRIKPTFPGRETPLQYRASFASMTDPKSSQGMNLWGTQHNTHSLMDPAIGDALVAIKVGEEAVVHKITVKGLTEEVIEVPFDSGVDPSAFGNVKLEFTEKDSRPVPGLKIRLAYTGKASKSSARLDLSFDAVTADDGMARFQKIPVGDYRIEILTERQRVYGQADSIRVPPKITAQNTIVLEPQAIFTPVAAGGRVVDSKGEPIAGVGVTVQWGGKMLDPIFSDVKTNARGEWSITGIEPEKFGGHAILYHHPLYPNVIENEVPPDSLLNRHVVLGRVATVRMQIILTGKPGKGGGSAGERQITLDELREKFGPEAVGCSMHVVVSGNVPSGLPAVSQQSGDILFSEPTRGVRLFPNVAGPFWSGKAVWYKNGDVIAVGGHVIPDDFEGELLVRMPVYEAVTRDVYFQFFHAVTGEPLPGVAWQNHKSDDSGRLKLSLLETADMSGVEGLRDSFRPPYGPINIDWHGCALKISDDYAVVYSSSGNVRVGEGRASSVVYQRNDFKTNSAENPIRVSVRDSTSVDSR